MEARPHAVVLALVAGVAACSSKSEATSTPGRLPASVTCDVGRGVTSDVGGFSRTTLSTDMKGPGFAAVGDMNGDGRADVVVSSLGPVKIDGAVVTLSPGQVDVFLQGSSAGCWQKKTILGDAENIHFPNRPTLEDVDHDGDLDVVQPTGFFVCTFDKAVNKCGGMIWLENQGSAFVRHDILTPSSSSFYHTAVLVDFDGDGTRDVVTVAESSAGAKTRWIRGVAGQPYFENSARDIGDGGGSFPIVADVDGDGKLDVASAEYFVEGSSFAWFERTADPSADNPSGTFVRHVIDATSGKGFMLQLVPNLYGDGVVRAVGGNHTNINDEGGVESGIFAFDLPSDPRTPWTKKRLSAGIVSRPSEGAGVQGAPGVFGVGDVDGDGDLDLAVAGDGDQKTYWMEQTSKGVFATHPLEEKLGQASGALVVDVDGDERNDLVFTGYEDGAVYLYSRK